MSTVPLPGHSIPYALTDQEIVDFLQQHQADPILSAYLYTKQPPYGVIIQEAYGQLLVWSDASGTLHVIDVTNMAIATQVEKAPYESPDASVIDNMIKQIQNIIDSLPSPSALANTVVLAAVVGLILVYAPRKK